MRIIILNIVAQKNINSFCIMKKYLESNLFYLRLPFNYLFWRISNYDKDYSVIFRYLQGIDTIKNWNIKQILIKVPDFVT